MPSPRPKNTVFIITDTQPTRMVGCYGNDWARTPRLDRMAAEGMTFDSAYTPCPLCTPARGAAFSGLQAACNGAWGNELAPSRAFPLMGEIMTRLGYRAGFTGKWHLDGAGYHGNGQADGGFTDEWWYDGCRYLQDIGQDTHRRFVKAVGPSVPKTGGLDPATAAAMREHDAAAAMDEAGCTAELVWGHRVVDRAIDFLERAGDEPFVLVVALDEPHGPFVAPPEFHGNFPRGEGVPPPSNYAADLSNKPRMQQHQAAEWSVPDNWDDFLAWRLRHLRCDSFADDEIGRVLDAVDAHHADDTLIIATTDHGDMMGSHGLLSKGAMMYDEGYRIPFIAKGPGISAGSRCSTPVSLLDILPTTVGNAGMEPPPLLQGCDLWPLLSGGTIERQSVHIQFNRFGVYHDGYGAFYPIRYVVDGRYKLAINLLDEVDEFYDLQEDPGEVTNLINEPGVAKERDRLHEDLLKELDRTLDPLRGPEWAARPWSTRSSPKAYFHGLESRPGLHRPRGFPWDPNNGHSPQPL